MPKRKAPRRAAPVASTSGTVDRHKGRVRATKDYGSALDKSNEELFVDEFERQGDTILLKGSLSEAGHDEGQADFEEVLPLALKRVPSMVQDEYEEEEDEELPAKKRPRKSAHDPLPSTKPGRFARPDPPQDASDSGSDSSSSDDEPAESWGNQYHVSRREMQAGPAKPRKKANGKRADDDDDGVDELREALAIQRAQRALLQPQDFGELSDAPEDDDAPSGDDTPAEAPVQRFDSRDAAIAHLWATQPHLLSLLTDYATLADLLPPLQRRLAALLAEPAVSPATKGIAALQVDLVDAYLTVGAFYFALAARRPGPSDLADRVLRRLVAVREQIQNMEDAGVPLDQPSDIDDAETDGASASGAESETDEGRAEMLQLLIEQQRLMKRLQAQQNGGDQANSDGSESDADFDLDAAASEGSDESEEEPTEPAKPVKVPAAKASPEKKRLTKAMKRQRDALAAQPLLRRSAPAAEALGDDFLEPAALSRGDAEDKRAKRHSLRFHTSQIAAKEHRRHTAASARMAGGDDDVPFVSKEAQRREAQRREAARVANELAAQSKAGAVRQQNGGEEAAAPSDESGYFDLVKSEKKALKEMKKEAYDAKLLEDRATLTQVEEGDGPRSISYAILANKGLTPKRNKLNRNPRVKKRHKYDKAQKKLGSMKAVYKADAAAAGRLAYAGEKSGIARRNVKSKKL